MTETDKSNQPDEASADTAGTPPAPASNGGSGAADQTQAAANTPEAGVDQLAVARQEAAAAQDRYLRAMADLENFRRRSMREKDELRAFAASRVVEELLPVLDNLGLGLAAAKAPNVDPASIVGGIEMIATQLKAALGNHGLKEVNPAGQPFDPNLHEAIAQTPSDEVEEGKVLQVVRIGYTLNGRLLRPASVVVSAGATAGKAKSS